MSYQIFVTKENDQLLVEALECLLSSTDDSEKRERIELALSGLYLNRPIAWGRVKDLWQPNKSLQRSGKAAR